MPTAAYVNVSSRQASKDDDPLHISMLIIIHVIVEPTAEQLRFPVHKPLESRRQVRTRLQAAGRTVFSDSTTPQAGRGPRPYRPHFFGCRRFSLKVAAGFGEEIAVRLRLHDDIRKPLKDAWRLHSWHSILRRGQQYLRS